MRSTETHRCRASLGALLARNCARAETVHALVDAPTGLASLQRRKTAPFRSFRCAWTIFRLMLRLPELTRPALNRTDEQVAPEPYTSSSTLSPIWNHSPPDSLISSAWYPGASSADPAMFTFAVGVKDHPVHLLDGNDRRVRASYPIVDHTERFVAPHSMTFSPDGSRFVFRAALC